MVPAVHQYSPSTAQRTPLYILTVLNSVIYNNKNQTKQVAVSKKEKSW